MLVAVVKGNIKETIALLCQLTDEIFCKKIPELSQATIGEHIRHTIELLNCLLDNYDIGIINYDLRERNIQLQTNVDYAVSILEQQLKHIEKLNKPLYLHHNCLNSLEKIQTNYFRELLYNLEHSIHHQALIKVALLHFPKVRVPISFGVAPSTLEYRKQCAQ